MPPPIPEPESDPRLDAEADGDVEVGVDVEVEVDGDGASGEVEERAPQPDPDEPITEHNVVLRRRPRVARQENPRDVARLREMWRRYKRYKDQAAREGLILNYSPLVKYVAGRMNSALPSHVEEADLISYGLLGLISAIERFEPSRKIKFETYAMSRIKGSIIDELRSLDWVPRSVRARARQIERAVSKLEGKLERAPTDEEIAAELEVTLEEFQGSLQQISNSSLVALDELWSVGGTGGDTIALIDTIEDEHAIDPSAAVDTAGAKATLADAIGRLPERERIVIALYYYENLTLREIGEVLGVTESRISQLHTKAVLRLRASTQAEE